MPGDSLNVNNKAVAQNTYDAIVIGSGISGGWAAKELTEKGLKVVAWINEKLYQSGRKYSDNFKETMTIVFDELLPKWNYQIHPL